MSMNLQQPSPTYFSGRQCSTLAGLAIMFCLNSCQPKAGPKPGDPPFTETQERRLRQVFKEEFAAAQMPEGGALDNKKLREEINKLVLAEVEEELAKGTVKEALNTEAVVKILKRAEKGHSASGELERIDLSQYPTVEGKVKRIMEEFDGVQSYSTGNPLVEQLKELGPQAKPQLYAALKKSSEQGGNWAARMAVAEALKPLLTIDDKDLLLEDLQTQNPQLVEVVRTLHLDEAGTVALGKMREYADKPTEFLSGELINIALEFEEEQALPLALARLGTPGSNSGTYLAQTLDAKFPELDMTAQLRAASTKLNNPYDSSIFSQLMLKRGMPEGLAIAADALLAKDVGHGWQYNREQVRSALRRYVNVTGSDEEVGKWLLENRAKLRWNPGTRMFEE